MRAPSISSLTKLLHQAQFLILPFYLRQKEHPSPPVCTPASAFILLKVLVLAKAILFGG